MVAGAIGAPVDLAGDGPETALEELIERRRGVTHDVVVELGDDDLADLSGVAPPVAVENLDHHVFRVDVEAVAVTLDG